MEKVHIIKGVPTGRIGGVYSNYEKAYTIAEDANKKRACRHRFCKSMGSVATKWIVKTFNVKE